MVKRFSLVSARELIFEAAIAVDSSLNFAVISIFLLRTTMPSLSDLKDISFFILAGICECLRPDSNKNA